MSKTSPTQRTLANLRRDGWTAAVTEKWNPHAGIRQDLFGFIDIVAIRPGETMGVQATTISNQSKRLAKIRDEPKARLWIEAGNRLQLWGWALKGPRGARKTWQTSITEVTLENIQQPAAERTLFGD